jgi:alcohol dehydrogenase class IV
VLIVTLTEEKKKSAVCGWDLFPRVSILDPEIVQSLPSYLTATTGMDALTHAIEGYVAKKSTPFSDALHRQVISLIGKSIRAAVADSSNLKAMGNMQVASTMAGTAFSSSGVGLVHAMSYPVTGYFGLSHGEANAILLPHVMRFNWISKVEKFADIVCLLGEPQTGSVVETARVSADVVANLASDVGIPSGLAQAGVKKERVEKMADEIPQSPNTLNNPRSASFQDVVRIYMEAM